LIKALDFQSVDKAETHGGHEDTNLACVAVRARNLSDLNGFYGREFLDENGSHPILLAMNVTKQRCWTHARRSYAIIAAPAI
jgi:hypothetical protein